MKTQMQNFVKEIITNATKLVEYKPEPIANRSNTRTFIWCVDKLPEGYIAAKRDTLYFVNDRHGYFVSNKDNIVNISSSIEDWDTGLDTYIETSKINMGVTGTKLLLNNNGDIEVYEVIGFDMSDGTRRYMR